MWIVYFWDAHENGVTAYVNKRKFDDYKAAKAFCKSVNGRMESRAVFA